MLMYRCSLFVYKWWIEPSRWATCSIGSTYLVWCNRWLQAHLLLTADIDGIHDSPIVLWHNSGLMSKRPHRPVSSNALNLLGSIWKWVEIRKKLIEHLKIVLEIKLDWFVSLHFCLNQHTICKTLVKL